jgi:hypothetical protein
MNEFRDGKWMRWVNLVDGKVVKVVKETRVDFGGGMGKRGSRREGQRGLGSRNTVSVRYGSGTRGGYSSGEEEGG